MEDRPASEDYFDPNDPPPKPDLYWHYLNRWAEEWARWLRALGFIALCVWAFPAHGTWKNEYAANHPNVQKWFKGATLTPLANARLGWTSCCEHADRLMTKVIPMVDRDGWMYYTDPNCTWKGCELAEIPQDTIHDDPIPKGAEFAQMRAEGVLFIYAGKVTCFWKPEGGI